MDKYRLDEDRNPILETNLFAWAQWYEYADRRVAFTDVNDVEISTVFLGLDHNHLGQGPPLLFETMIFGGEHDGWMDRYTTWEEAEAGHNEAVSMVEGKLVHING